MSDDIHIPMAPPARQLHSRWMLASGNFFFRVRNALFPVVFMILMLVTRPAQFLHRPDWDRIVMLAGVCMALAGQAFRLFVIGFAYIQRGGKNRQVYADKLVVAGLYAHTRNPMYVGNFLIACGLGIFYGSPWMYLFVIPFFTWVYLAITAAEEQYLLGRFGSDYEDYLAKVPRFIPDFHGLSRSLSGYPYRWREALAKEYGTLFGTLAGLTAIAMWKTFWLHGWAQQRAEILALAWLFVPWTGFYATIRFLKRTGRLKQPAPPPGGA